jgi:hypothetical protein
MGADDFISKPFLPSLLILRVKAHLRRLYQYDLPSVQPVEAEAEDNNPLGRFKLKAGWTGCPACGYSGSTELFQRTDKSGERTLACPHCQNSEQLTFG